MNSRAAAEQLRINVESETGFGLVLRSNLESRKMTSIEFVPVTKLEQISTSPDEHVNLEADEDDDDAELDAEVDRLQKQKQADELRRERMNVFAGRLTRFVRRAARTKRLRCRNAKAQSSAAETQISSDDVYSQCGIEGLTACNATVGCQYCGVVFCSSISVVSSVVTYPTSFTTSGGFNIPGFDDYYGASGGGWDDYWAAQSSVAQDTEQQRRETDKQLADHKARLSSCLITLRACDHPSASPAQKSPEHKTAGFNFIFQFKEFVKTKMCRDVARCSQLISTTDDSGDELLNKALEELHIKRAELWSEFESVKDSRAWMFFDQWKDRMAQLEKLGEALKSKIVEIEGAVTAAAHRHAAEKERMEKDEQLAKALEAESETQEEEFEIVTRRAKRGKRGGGGRGAFAREVQAPSGKAQREGAKKATRG